MVFSIPFLVLAIIDYNKIARGKYFKRAKITLPELWIGDECV
jgi:hypothetical protein